MQLSQSLLSEIKSIIARSQDKAIRSVDTERVRMYWQIGKVIFEEEQQGEDRATYGSFLIKSLSEQLQPQFGSGFFPAAVRAIPAILSGFPNCVRSADAIQLDSL